MKTQLFFALCLILFSMGCTKEDEFISSAALKSNHNLGALSQADVESLSLLNCIELETNLSLSGTTKLKSPKDILEGKQISTSPIVGRGILDCYSIEATGDGWSKELARCITTVNFNYWPVTRRLTGTINSVFSNGERLEQFVDGIADVTHDGQYVLNIDLSAASLENENEKLILGQGQVSFNFPNGLIGKIEFLISTKGSYCSE